SRQQFPARIIESSMSGVGLGEIDDGRAAAALLGQEQAPWIGLRIPLQAGREHARHASRYDKGYVYTRLRTDYRARTESSADFRRVERFSTRDGAQSRDRARSFHAH